MAYTESSRVSRFGVFSFGTEGEALAFVQGVEYATGSRRPRSRSPHPTPNDTALHARTPVFRRGQWHVRVDDKVVDETTISGRAR